MCFHFPCLLYLSVELLGHMVGQLNSIRNCQPVFCVRIPVVHILPSSLNNFLFFILSYLVGVMTSHGFNSYCPNG